MGERRTSVELRVVSESGTVEHSIRLPRTMRALVVTALVTALSALIGAAAVAPSVIATVRARREYVLQQARRSQLGERLRALVEELARVDQQGELLAQRVARIESVYGVGRAEPPEVEVKLPPDRAAQTIFVATIARGRYLAATAAARIAWVDRRVAALAAFESAHPDLPSLMPVRWPLGGETSVPTSGFGVRRIPGGGALEFHSGLDIAAPAGTQVVSTAEGQVVWAGEAPPDAGPAWWRLGRLVAVRHGDRFLTLYGHCERSLVARGHRVRAGEAIAIVGATGWTASPELHYEIRRRADEGEWLAIDPRRLLLSTELADSSAQEPGTRGPEPAPLPRAFLR